MRFSRTFAATLASLMAMATLYPVPSSAQCLLCQAPSATVDADSHGEGEERPLHIEVTATLDFARLVAGQSGGTVRVDPGGGSVVTSGDVRAAAGLAFSGRILVTGTPRRMVRIELPELATLSSAAGGSVRLTQISTGQPPLVRIGPDGRLDIPFGGQLELHGAVDGDFRWRIPVSVSYE